MDILSNTVALSRMQFALTAIFHMLWPVLTTGMGIYLVIVEGMWLDLMSMNIPYSRTEAIETVYACAGRPLKRQSVHRRNRVQKRASFRYCHAAACCCPTCRCCAAMKIGYTVSAQTNLQSKICCRA